MNTHTTVFSLVPAVCYFLAWVPVAFGAGSQEAPVPESIVAVLPRGVNPGYFGPPPSKGASKSAAARDPQMVRRAVERAIGYVKSILQDEWLPTDTSQLDQRLQLIDDDFDEIDTIRTDYARNGYRVQIVQSANLFALVFSPESSSSPQSGSDALAIVKALGSRALRHWDRIERISFGSPASAPDGIYGEPNYRVREETAAQILKEQRRIDQEFAEPAPPQAPPSVGASATPEQIKAAQEASRKYYEQCREWEERCRKIRSARAEQPRESSLWWGWIGWWTDGQRVAFYTITGASLIGAWGPSYEGIPEKSRHWFEAIPSDPEQRALRGYR